MSKHEDTVDETVIEIAKQIHEFVTSIMPDIGFSEVDMAYSIGLVMAKIQDDVDLSHEILDECYTMAGELLW